MHPQAVDRLLRPAGTVAAERVLCPDPGCRRPARIEDRWTWSSTAGPVEVAKVRCEAGCWYTVEAADLSALDSRRADNVPFEPPAAGNGIVAAVLRSSM